MLSRNQEIPWLLDLERNVSIKKKEGGKNFLFEALPYRFC